MGGADPPLFGHLLGHHFLMGLTSSRTVELVGVPTSSVGLDPISHPVISDAHNSAQPASQAYWVDGKWPIGPLPMHLCAGSEVCGIGNICEGDTVIRPLGQ